MSKETIKLADKLAARLNGRTVTVSPGLREEIEAAAAALRASAVAEPVADKLQESSFRAGLKLGWNLAGDEAAFKRAMDAHSWDEIAASGLYAHPAPAAPVPAIDRCAKCGEPRKEHAYNGACYGVCGEFVAAAPVPASVRETLVQRIQDNVYRANGCTLNCDVSDAIRSALASLPAPEAAPSNAPYYHAWLEVIDLCNKLKDENYALRNAAAPTREEIAETILDKLTGGHKSDLSGEWLCPLDDEGAREQCLDIADAILALKAAPAK